MRDRAFSKNIDLLLDPREVKRLEEGEKDWAKDRKRLEPCMDEPLWVNLSLTPMRWGRFGQIGPREWKRGRGVTSQKKRKITRVKSMKATGDSRKLTKDRGSLGRGKTLEERKLPQVGKRDKLMLYQPKGPMHHVRK